MDHPQTFPAMLSEMRQALQEEIKANQQEKRRYRAHSGKDLSASGLFRYQFQLDARWEPRIDTPLLIEFNAVAGESGELQGRIENFQQMQATITLVTEEPLPSHALAKVRLSENTSQLLQQLEQALDGRQEGAFHLASKLFGLMEATDGHVDIPARIGSFVPDDAQRRAIARALANEVLYLIGPPGTGKTVTLAAIALLALQRGQSVLLAAHTNIALDNAMVRLVDLVGACNEAWRMKEGQIIRQGTSRLADFASDPYRQVTIRGRTRDLAERLEHLEVERVELAESHEREERTVAQQTRRWEATQQRYQTQLERYQQQLSPLETQERQRLARLDQESQRLHREIQSKQQRAKEVKDRLASLRQEERDLLKAQQRISTRGAEMAGTLERINKAYWRWLYVAWHGHDVVALERALEDLRSDWTTNQQSLSGLATAQQEARRQQEQFADELAALTRQAQQAAQASSTPSVETRQILSLQAEMQQVRAQIAQGNRVQAQAVAHLEQQQHDYTHCCQQITQLRAEIRYIESQSLKFAGVVGATLTTLYLHPYFSEHAFDLVIVDETSMAAPGAVCFAATCARQGVVVIGDPLQLAPICQSTEAGARKWVGTDVYTLVGVTVDEAASGAHHSVLLTHQARMHPHISALVNNIFYKGYLRDRPRPAEDWLQVAPFPKQALLLCDTGSAKPRTQRPESGKSRYNTYHVEVVIALARQALASLPPAAGISPRVGIVTPYAPQVYELRRRLREEHLEMLVQVGTVHAYQGLEFDVVIYDTVESPPLGLTPNFTAGAWGSEAMRLVNVALSRARHKLMIVANLNYLRDLQRGSGTEHILVSVVEEASRQGFLPATALFGDGE